MLDAPDILQSFLTVAYLYLSIVCIVVILLENKNPVRTMAWVMVLVFLPLLGLFLYMVFGRSFHRQKRISRKLKSKIYNCASPQLSRSIKSISADSEVVDRHIGLIRMLQKSGEAELFANNNVDIFTDGKSLLDRMIADIEKATNHIHVEYYIIESDETGGRFKNALIEKVRQGVEVRLIYDDFGSWHLKRSAVKEMRQAGIKLQSFFEIRFPYFTNKLNYRNHRKILVIDGKVGYLGGFNIADRYTKGLKWGYWRDTHIRFEGDGVAGLQTLFLTDWMYTSKKLHKTPRFFPVSQLHNNTCIQVVGSGPDMDWQPIMQTFCHAIHRAVKYIYIQTPYFLPNESINNALETAALGGIDVQVMIPYRSDARFVYEASLTYIAPLLKAGVKVFQYTGGFIHSKIMVVDDEVAIVGSANMDYRSFDQNFEVCAIIYDKKKGEELRRIFTDDLKKSRRILPDKWQRRPWWRKLIQSIARLFSPIF